jgi:hypothetical protein
LSIYFANKQCLQSLVRLLVGGLPRLRGPGREEVEAQPEAGFENAPLRLAGPGGRQAAAAEEDVARLRERAGR